jgi:PAS domain S-box-containing protein
MAEAGRERAEAVAARLETEEALRESEERTRLIVSHALDAVITIDAQGHITSWNPTAESMFGWTWQEIGGRLLSEAIIPPAYRDAHKRGLAHFRDTGQGPVLDRRIELTALRRDGTEFPVELAITAIRMGGATAFSAFLRDITERKTAEAALRDSEASFRLLFADNPVPMWVYDQETLSFLEVNDAAIAQYGYSRDEFLGMRITDIRPPEDVPSLENALAALAAAPDQRVRGHATSWRHRLKDGRVRDVGIASHSIEFAGRRAALVVATDITELKQAEAALTRYAERLQILHGIDAAIIAADAPAAIAEAVLRRLRDLLGVPRAIVNMFDLEAGEVEWLAAVGRRRSRVGPGVRFPLTLMGDVDGLRRGELQVIDTAALPLSPEVEALLGSGVHTYMVVPMIVGGELIGGLSFGGAPGEFSPEQIGIAQEVAAQLAIAIAQARLHERVKAQAAELEGRVRERTLELSVANEQLEQEIADRRRAEAEADHANRAKSDFLSGMSHELRTPLNGILGFAELMHDGKVGPVSAAHKEFLGDILTSSRHLLRLINDILDLSKIEAGKMEFRPEPVSLGAIVTEVRDVTRPLAADHGITVEVEIDPGVSVVSVDPGGLRQILYNYLSNALKFSPDGARVIIRAAPEGAHSWQLEVEDEGTGISAEDMGRLFGEFQQLDSGVTGRHKGTGLGLALTKRIVEAHGGRVGVRSAPGHGSVFFAILPGRAAA